MTRSAHEVDYTIHGAEMQFVEIGLDPGETVIAEAGALMYMEQGIQMETGITDLSDKNTGLFGTVGGIAKRKLTGEDVFVTAFTNKGAGLLNAAFAAPFPGKIIALDLADIGGQVLCQKGAFLCAAKGVSINLGLTKRVSTGLFGGEGFIFQRLDGDGLAFIHSGGTVVERVLGPDETLYVDTGSLVAMQPTIDFEIQIVKGVTSMLFGGEGIFLSTLKGPGRVWIQSLPFPRFLNTIGIALKDMLEK